MSVLSIKVSIRKKSGNLFDDRRISIIEITIAITSRLLNGMQPHIMNNSSN